MYRRAIVLSVGLGLCVPSARPQASTSVLTPDQLVEAALARNRDFFSLKQRITEAQGLLKQAGVGPADNVELGGIAGQVLGNAGEDSFTAAYSHIFETFGKRRKRIAVAQTEVALAKAELSERRRALTLEIKKRYADAASEHKKLAVIDRLLSVNREYLKLTDARVQKGDAAPLEADLLRVELSRDQAQRALSDGRARSAVLRLKTSLDLGSAAPLSVTFSLTPPAFQDDLSGLQALALANRPDLALLRIAEDQSATQIELTKAEANPNVIVSGQYSHVDSAFGQYGLTTAGAPTPIRDHDNSVGFGLSIPLTSTRRNRGNIEAAAARQAGARLRREYLEGIIPTQVEAAYQRWSAAQDAAALYARGVIDQSEKNLAVMRQAYNLGELRLIDIINEQRRLLDVEFNYIDTQGDLYRAYAELEQAAGGSLP